MTDKRGTPQKIIDSAMQMVRDGVTYEQIAEHYGVDASTVGGWWRGSDDYVKPDHSLSQEIIDDIRQMKKDGMVLMRIRDAIVEKHGRSLGTNRISKLCVDMPKPKPVYVEIERWWEEIRAMQNVIQSWGRTNELREFISDAALDRTRLRLRDGVGPALRAKGR